MPYLTGQLGQYGPLVEVFVGVTLARKALLEKHGLAVAAGVRARALIDPGASISIVDAKIPKELGLHPTGKISILTPSTGLQPHECAEYDVSVTLLHPAEGTETVFGHVPVAESTFHPTEPYQILIGRDLLQHCLLVYDGKGGSFAFAF
jgi:hypothetical protein